jgi:hypothetical protein
MQAEGILHESENRKWLTRAGITAMERFFDAVISPA